MDSERLPKTVPVLTARKMHKGNYDGPRGTHCLLGWKFEAGLRDPRWWESVRCAASDLLRTDVPYPSIVGINDSPKNSKALLARIWNRAMRKLGYVKDKSGKRFVLKARAK